MRYRHMKVCLLYTDVLNSYYIRVSITCKNARWLHLITYQFKFCGWLYWVNTIRQQWNYYGEIVSLEFYTVLYFLGNVWFWKFQFLRYFSLLGQFSVPLWLCLSMGNACRFSQNWSVFTTACSELSRWRLLTSISWLCDGHQSSFSDICLKHYLACFHLSNIFL